MVRFVLLNAFIAILTIIFCIGAILLSPFDKTGRKIRFYISMPWAKTILRVCGIKVLVKGKENVRDHIPSVFMCNHQSYFDIFALLAYLPADFKFILKQELMEIPLLGAAMKRAGHIAIKRENAKQAIRSMDMVAEKIKSGNSYLVFPEGTRSIDGRLQPLKKGGFHMALKSGCEIVPVAISNSCRIVPKGSLKINKGSFHMYFGEPISIKDYNRKNLPELLERVRTEMLNLMETKN